MTTLCNYLQESAGNHAAHLNVSVERLQPLHMTWVLSKLHIQVHRYPSWQEEVHLETWPSGHNGLLASREFRLLDAAGDSLAVASTAWLIVNTQRLRPVRIPDFVDEIRTPLDELPIPDAFPRLSLPEAPALSRSFDVRRQDIDMNGHANNVAFIGWALEALPAPFAETHMPMQCEIAFKAEATAYQQVLSTASGEGSEVVHGLFVEGEKPKEIARVRTRWAPRVDG